MNKHRSNKMESFLSFIDSWHNINHPDNQELIEFGKTIYGNINLTGEVGDYRGHALSKFHSQFLESLEKGIQPLVVHVVESFNWITYTSCEGHIYLNSSELPAERHIGIVSRSHAEQTNIWDYFSKAAKHFNDKKAPSPLFIDVFINELEDNGEKYPVIDVFFRKYWYQSWDSYFANLDRLFQDFMTQLENES